VAELILALAPALLVLYSSHGWVFSAATFIACLVATIFLSVKSVKSVVQFLGLRLAAPGFGPF
jgi:uncharacterized membrane protein